MKTKNNNSLKAAIQAKKESKSIKISEMEKQVLQRNIHEAQKSTINSRLREIRTLLRLKQSEMAKELDTTQGNISQIEQGVVVPSGQFFQRIAERFPDVNFNWIIYNEGAPLKSTSESMLEKDLRSSSVSHQREKELEAELARMKADQSNLLAILAKQR